MCYACLSTLNNLINSEQIDKLKTYFLGLNSNTRDLITVSKISLALNIDNKKAVQVILFCEEIGVLSRHFGIRCPKCGIILRDIPEPDITDIIVDECYSCDEEINITIDDVIVLFTLVKVEFPFEAGQQSERMPEESASVVAREDLWENVQIFINEISEEKCRKREEEYKKEIELQKRGNLHKQAVKQAGNNRIINVLLNVISVFVVIAVIYAVYRKYGLEKIPIFLSFSSFVIPFGCNYIVREIFLTDINRIEEKLLANEKE